MNEIPETKYARSGDVHIAYHVVGDGPIDAVVVPGWVSHVELAWELPQFRRFYERLASFSRLMVLDKRGTGAWTESPACRRWRSAWTTCAP
jgi:hypothetical protein